MKSAESALYRAKLDLGVNYRSFDLEVDVEARKRDALASDLRRALSRNEFEVHFQMVFDFEDVSVRGAEALVRWRHPELGMVRPDQFIPLAEETGLIIPIGEWILKSACCEAVKWPCDLKVSVNLSAVQFKRGNLMEIVRAALAESGLPAERLELEITESVSLQKNAHNLDQLLEIKKLGVSIALDDFGTGFSSLSYLRSFPFDVIKIDRSFVTEIASRRDCAAIVDAIVALGKSLGAETIAEGIETPEQFDILRRAGCVLAQGYMLSEPRPASELVFMQAMGSVPVRLDA